LCARGVSRFSGTKPCAFANFADQFTAEGDTRLSAANKNKKPIAKGFQLTDAMMAEFRESFKAYYGPVLSVYRSLGNDAERVAALDAALDELARSADIGRDGSLVMEWEYLLLTATRT